MRLVGIGLLAFVLAGLLILLGRGGAFDAGINKLSGDKQQFSNYERTVKRGFNISGTDVFTADHDSSVPAILSGMPSYAKQTYRMPVDSRPVSGQYALVFSSRAAEGIEGVLRVSINGIKRADILLDQSRSLKTVKIELTASELSSAALNIGLSLQGRGAIPQCSPDESIAAVVEIKPESGLRLKLAKPLETTRDRLVLWGGRIPVSWDARKANADTLKSIMHSARLVQKGYSVHFDKDGLDTIALSKLSGEADAYGHVVAHSAFPIALTSNINNRGLKKFARQTSWRYNYNAKDMPDHALPSALDMKLTVGPTGHNISHDVAVTLNGHMLFSRRLSPQTDRINQSIKLPARLHKTANTVEISLTKSGSGGKCFGTSTQSVAELLPDTVLRGGGQKAADNLSILREKLLSSGTATLTGEMQTAVDAQAAAQLLGQLEPRSLTFVKDPAATNIRVIIGDVIAALGEQDAKADDWIVYRSGDRESGIVAMPVKDMPTLSGPAVALLISLSDNEAGVGASGQSG